MFFPKNSASVMAGIENETTMRGAVVMSTGPGPRTTMCNSPVSRSK